MVRGEVGCRKQCKLSAEDNETATKEKDKNEEEEEEGDGEF